MPFISCAEFSELYDTFERINCKNETDSMVQTLHEMDISDIKKYDFYISPCTENEERAVHIGVRRKTFRSRLKDGIDAVS